MPFALPQWGTEATGRGAGESCEDVGDLWLVLWKGPYKERYIDPLVWSSSSFLRGAELLNGGGSLHLGAGLSGSP